MANIQTAKPDREGIVAAIAAPDYPHPDGIVYFTFSIERTAPPPPTREVLYLEMQTPTAAATIAVIAAAFSSGHAVQIGLKGTEKDKWRTVDWVQAVRRV